MKNWKETAQRTKELAKAISTELDRLGVLESEEKPTGAVVETDNCSNGPIPLGWVRFADDWSATCGPAPEILATLKLCETDREGDITGDYCSSFSDTLPTEVADWPEDLIEVHPLEEGTTNDSLNTLVLIYTNSGPRFAAGPHGVFCDVLSESISNNCLYRSEEDALQSIS